MAGVSQMLFGMALGVHGIVAWENVFDADGQPLPLGEEAVREMLRTHPVLASDFVAKYTAPLTEAIVEGNESGAAPTGTLAAARGSAKTAGTSTTAKPAGGNRKTRRANARTSGTPRKRSTAS